MDIATIVADILLVVASVFAVCMQVFLVLVNVAIVGPQITPITVEIALIVVDVLLLFGRGRGIALFQVLVAFTTIFGQVFLVFVDVAGIFIPVNAVLVKVALI